MNSKQLSIFLVLSIFLFAGCIGKNSSRGYEGIATEGFQKLATMEKKIEWLDIILYKIEKAGKPEDKLALLKEVAVKAQGSTFGSYVYFMISDLYWVQKEQEIANFYMHQVPEEHYYLLYNEQEIGYLIALRSISLDNNLALKEKKCLYLLEHYPDLVDEDTILYELILIYKEQYDIARAVACMEKIITLSNTNKSLDKRIELGQLMEEVQFYYSKKNWLNKDLKVLMGNIKSAIQNKDINRLETYMTRINFEIIEPQRFNRRSISLQTLSIQSKWHSNVTFESDLEEYSNENEVYWKTRNWDFPNMREWFFYFRRIHYPYDETIDGAWEWKAIYFGSIH